MTRKQLELARRKRVVQGWRHREDFGPRERNAVRAYLRGETGPPARFAEIDKVVGFGRLLDLHSS
jgi:hypothetical protein